MLPYPPHTQVRDSECDLEFLRHLLPTLSWKGLKSAAEDLGLDASVLPDEVSSFRKLLGGQMGGGMGS